MIKDRLGYYLVGWKKFYNKTLALIESKKTGFEIKWIFNDDVYGSFDWSIPIPYSLKELYRKRALQIRETYDYVILYYSGGSDSGNILRTFVENNIFIDEIVLMVVEPDRHNLKDMDTSPRNLYAEIDYIAVPELKKLENQLSSKTKITIQDCAKPAIELLHHDDWWELHTPSSGMTLGNLARQYFPLHDKHFADIFSSGKKTCQLLGIDKPLVWFDGLNYFAFFADNNAYHITPVEVNYNKDFNNNFVTEYFYWTRDMPEIVIKQAQEIVAHCKSDASKQMLWSQSLKKNIGEYRDAMHPIIYPGLASPKFQTRKTKAGMDREGLDDWFWKTAPISLQRNYSEVFDYLDRYVDNRFSIDGNFKNGLTSINSKFYKL